MCSYLIKLMDSLIVFSHACGNKCMPKLPNTEKVILAKATATFLSHAYTTCLWLHAVAGRVDDVDHAGSQKY